MNDQQINPDGSDFGDEAGMHRIVDETSALIDELQTQVQRLTQERNEAQNAHKLALADFQNYQRRAMSNETEARQQGVRSVLHSVMPVLDHFDMALLSNPEKVSAQQVMDGVQMIKTELIRALSAHGVHMISPAKDDMFDPQRHEAIMHQTAEGVQPGHVVITLRPGFTLNDRLVRPAQVSVAPTE